MVKGILWLVGLFLALALAGSVLVSSSYVQWRTKTDLAKGAELYDPSTQRFTAAGAHECSGSGALVKAPSGAITLEGCGDGAHEWNPSTRTFRKVPQPDEGSIGCGSPLQDGRQASVTTPTDATDGSVLNFGFRSQCRTLPTPRPVSADTLVLLPGERLFISGSTLAWSEQEWQRKDRFFAVVELGTSRWVDLPAPPDGSAIEIVRAAAASPSQVFVATGWYVGDVGHEGPWQAWLLDLTARTWTPAPLPTGGSSAPGWPGRPVPSLSEGVLVGIPAGGVLLAKGQGNWSFSPATRAWSPVAPMLEPRSSPSALVLPDGKVLFATGSTQITRTRYDLTSATRFAVMVVLPLAVLGLAFYLSRRFQAPLWSRLTAVVLSLLWTGLFALVLAGLSGLHGRPARTRNGTGPRRLRQPRARFRARPNAGPRAPSSLREAFRWACDARLELASVTAFEELADALEALRAPRALIERCHHAAAQESVHARLCAERVSALSPVELSLTPLGKLPDESRSLEETLVTIACDSLADGCLGEGEAALSAKRSAERAHDPATRAVFETIARDEHAHAELAWSVLEYCLSHDLPAVREAVTQTLAQLQAPSGAPELLAQVTERTRGLLRHAPSAA